MRLLVEKSLTFHLIATTFLTCFGSSMLYGYNIAVINLPGEHIRCFLKSTILKIPCKSYDVIVNDTAQATGSTEGDTNFLYALVSAVFVVAGACGAFSTGWVADFFGRRNGLLFNHIFIIIGGIVVAPTVASRLPVLLYLGRVFIGFNCGITIGLASIYLTEIAPTKYRGAIGACHQLAVTIGIVVSYILTLNCTMNSPKLWSLACFLTCIPAVISLCLLPFCPESPRFLFLKRGDKEAARAAFLKVNQIEDPDLFLAELQEEVEFAKTQPAFRFLNLFTLPDLRMPLIIACLFQIMQQFSGINAVITYSNIMLKTAGVSDSYNELCVLLIGVFNVICTIIALPLLERFGRRTLILVPSLFLMVSLFVLTITVNVANRAVNTGARQTAGVISVVFVFIYIFGFAMGLGPVPALIVSEIFRQGPRGAAYSVSQFLQWTSTLCVLITFPNMNAAIEGYSFLPFLVVVILCLVFFWLYMPETRGRTFDDIARDLAPGKRVAGQSRVAEFQPESVDAEKHEALGEVEQTSAPQEA